MFLQNFNALYYFSSLIIHSYFGMVKLLFKLELTHILFSNKQKRVNTMELQQIISHAGQEPLNQTQKISKIILESNFLSPCVLKPVTVQVQA